MANKTRTYDLTWGWKVTGNRDDLMTDQVKATTVQRAVGKLVKALNEGDIEPEGGFPVHIKDDDDIRASDLLIVAATPTRL